MQRSDREMYIHEYFEKKIFIPPHRINTNNAFNNRSGRIARNYRSLPFEDTASITIFRLNGLNKQPRFNICDGGTIVMKIESGAGRGVHYRGGCTRETRTKRRKGVRSEWWNVEKLNVPPPLRNRRSVVATQHTVRADTSCENIKATHPCRCQGYNSARYYAPA